MIDAWLLISGDRRVDSGAKECLRRWHPGDANFSEGSDPRNVVDLIHRIRDFRLTDWEDLPLRDELIGNVLFQLDLAETIRSWPQTNMLSRRTSHGLLGKRNGYESGADDRIISSF